MENSIFFFGSPPYDPNYLMTLFLTDTYFMLAIVLAEKKKFTFAGKVLAAAVRVLLQLPASYTIHGLLTVLPHLQDSDGFTLYNGYL